MEYKVYVWDYGDDIYVFRNGMTIWGKLYLDKGSVANDEKTIIFQGNINGGNPIADVVYPAPRLGSEKPIPGLSELGINMISVTG